VTEVQDLAFGLVETHTSDLSPSIQPVQILYSPSLYFHISIYGDTDFEGKYQ